MALDEDLVHRLRELLAAKDGITERRMFGGLAFLLNGHMSVTASREGDLLVRIDPATADRELARDHVTPMVMRGRELDGWLRVAPAAIGTKRRLDRWVELSLRYVGTLPPKGS